MKPIGDVPDHEHHINRATEAAGTLHMVHGRITKAGRAIDMAYSRIQTATQNAERLLKEVPHGDEDLAADALRKLDDAIKGVRTALAEARKEAGSASESLLAASGGFPTPLHIDRLFPSKEGTVFG